MTTAEAWDGAANLHAYAEVETPENYTSAVDLRAYREERIHFHDAYVGFLRELGTPPGGLRVVDVGSGSSAFLYALDRAGLLASGLGIEVSPSRHAFAERWRADEGFTRVTNVCADFRHVTIDAASADAFTVVDETYLYLRPERDDNPAALLETAARTLSSGGVFVAAFRNDAATVDRIGEGRTFWVELSESNPFRYALYRQQASADGRRVRTESRYLAQDGGERRKVEITEVCDVEALQAAILGSGFSAVSLYEDFAFSPFRADSSSNVVLVARR